MALPGLIVPTALVTTGPTYANNINSDLTTLDTHDHSSGKGSAVSTGSLLGTADLTFNGFGPILQRYSRFHATALPSAGTFPASLFVNAAGNLYYEDSSSNQIQLTSGGAISPNGTGASNGFYGDYATNPKGIAYYSASYGYQFGGGGTNPPTLVSLANLTAANIMSGTGISGGFLSNTLAAPQQGFQWQMNASPGNLVLAFDNTSGAGNGTFNKNIGSFRWISLVNTTNNFAFGINTTTPAVPLDVAFGSGTTTAQDIANFTLKAVNGGVSAAFGPRMGFYASSTSGGGGVRQGAITGFFSNFGSQYGGLRLFGAAGNAFTGTAGIEVQNVNNAGDAVGIGGAALSSQLLTIYGVTQVRDSILPDSNNTRSIGTNSNQFSDIWVTTLHGTSGLTLSTAASGITIAPNNSVTSVTGALAVSTTTSTTVLTTSDTTSSGGTSTRNATNNVTAWARSNSSGTVLSGYNITGSANHTGTGVYVYTLTNHTGQVGALSVINTDTSNDCVKAAWTANGQVTVTIENRDGSTFEDRGHCLVVVGGT